MKRSSTHTLILSIASVIGHFILGLVVRHAVEYQANQWPTVQKHFSALVYILPLGVYCLDYCNSVAIASES